MKHDLHFALCTNCTSSRPTVIYDKEEINPEIYDDVNIKSNNIPTACRDTISSIDRERLTLVPINHLPRHRLS